MIIVSNLLHQNERNLDVETTVQSISLTFTSKYYLDDVFTVMPPTVGSFYGPMLVGAFFNVLFHGVFVLQAFNYWQTYKRDSLWLKALVLYLFVAETANSVATIFIVYQPLVLQNGTKLPLTILPTMLAGDPIITALISTPVQIFIAYRMKVLSKSWILPAIVTLIALASLGGSLWLGGILIGIKHFPHNGEHETPFKVWLATSAAADIFITAGLTWSLQGSKAGLSGTDSVPKKIVRLIIQTGLLTSVLALLDIVLFCKVPTSTVNFTLDFMIAKLYGITLLRYDHPHIACTHQTLHSFLVLSMLGLP
ncbi:hypothetical protein DL96DRAFT_775197 [Flagelloscypha sp. PMI_526]|nr:hypothetical protein DL96DRAFT_775197 [Flagelloscypha sp. PMI_526]